MIRPAVLLVLGCVLVVGGLAEGSWVAVVSGVCTVLVAVAEAGE